MGTESKHLTYCAVCPTHPLHLLKQGLLQDLWLHQLAKLTGQGALWSYTHSYQPCHPWDYWYTPPCPTLTWVRGIQIQGLMLVWQIAQLLNFIILYGHASTFLPVRELLKAPQFKSRPKATLQLLPFSQLFGHGDTKAIDVTRLCSKASVSWIHTLSFSNSVALDYLLNSLDINYHIHKVEKCLSPPTLQDDMCEILTRGMRWSKCSFKASCYFDTSQWTRWKILFSIILFSVATDILMSQEDKWILSTAYALCVH